MIEKRIQVEDGDDYPMLVRVSSRDSVTISFGPDDIVLNKRAAQELASFLHLAINAPAMHKDIPRRRLKA